MFGSELPRSVLGGLAARVAPVLAESSAQDAKHTSAARRTHHSPRPAPDGATPIKGLIGDNSRASPIGRGGGSPNLARWGNANARTNATDGSPRSRRWGKAKHEPTPHNGSPNLARWRNANARTNAAAPKADAQVGLNGDSSRTMAFGAGGSPLFLSRVDRRLRAPKVRFPFAAAAQPTLHHLSTTAPSRSLSISLSLSLSLFSLSFLSRFSTHDPTLRREQDNHRTTTKDARRPTKRRAFRGVSRKGKGRTWRRTQVANATREKRPF